MMAFSVSLLGFTTFNRLAGINLLSHPRGAPHKSSAEVRDLLSKIVVGPELPVSKPFVVPTKAKSLPAWLKHDEWQRLPFGVFADSVNDRVEPSEAADEIYVGLDDLDPGSFHIRRWGKGSDVIGTKLRFRKGDIIFGRRRAYQRKLAVAEMDGICSAHSLVLRAKPDFILPEFLPFLMMSDKFMNRAVEISVGSLSPTINWTTLKLEEFDLPPLDQQRRIADILWTLDHDEQTKAALSTSVRSMLNAKVEETIEQLLKGPCEALEKLLTGSPESGVSAPPNATDTGHFVLSLAALSSNGYFRGNLKPIPPTKAMLDCRLSSGDFLISRSNTRALVGLVGIFDEEREDVSFPDTMMRLPVNESKVLKPFLEAVLQSRHGRLHMMRSAAGTSDSMKKINRRTLGSCVIPTPALSVQQKFLRKLDDLRALAVSTDAARDSAKAFKVALLKAFG